VRRRSLLPPKAGASSPEDINLWQADQIELSTGWVEAEEFGAMIATGQLEPVKGTAAKRSASRAPAKTGAERGQNGKRQPSSFPDTTAAGIPLADLADVNAGAVGRRSKRSAILDTAVARFGETGYEATKWSTVADEVGIGQTALYHYFESKAHCLLTIIRIELAQGYQRFLAAIGPAESSAAAVEAALTSAFDVTTAEVRQIRIVMANGDVLANPRPSEREETERLRCLELTRMIEDAWARLLQSKLDETGDERDARMLSRALLGLINSVWRWYRPSGKRPLDEVADFYVTSALRIVG
jgi:TetR/AcrR family transcriptional regulator, cholesterol catabolism regulator